MESGDSWKIADLVVVGYFKGVASFICAQIFHTDGSKAEFDVNSVPANYRMLSGSDAVRKAMYPDNFNQPDPRFAQYAKPIIESLQDAEDFIEGYICACSSDIGRELDPESWRITGGRIHVARITPERGFEWIILP